MKFSVTVTEILTKEITVEAASKEEAETEVEKMWNDSEIILDAGDFLTVEFKAVLVSF